MKLYNIKNPWLRIVIAWIIILPYIIIAFSVFSILILYQAAKGAFFYAKECVKYDLKFKEMCRNIKNVLTDTQRM